LNRHLTIAEIEQYVTRSGGVDEIIAFAEHLEACFECRDRAVAIVDPGTTAHELRERELPHEARRAITTGVVVTCIAVVVIVIAILLFVLGQK
jgi:hypothetical protein